MSRSSRIDRRGFIAAASTALATCRLLPAPAQETEERFSPAAVRADLDAIWSALLDVSPQPFRSSNPATVEAVYRSARAQSVSPLTVRETWLVIAPVLGALNDGHVGLLFPGTLNLAPFRFPLRFALDANDALIVIGDHTGTIPIGSRIVSIEGISGERYRDATLAAFGGQTAALHRSRVRTAGAWTAIAMFGDRASYGVSWTTLEGAVRTAAIAAPAHWQHAPSTAPYAYSTLQDGKVGLIDYRACEDLARFKQFMTATLQQIRQAPIQALIVDIRRNGGGDSDLNDVLWTSVSNKPFKQFGGAIEKASDRLKREYGREKYVAIYGERAWSAPNGTILQLGTDPSEGLTVPGPVANRYAGPVYLLISTATFSSAMSCALAAKDYGLATLVGEETGEPATSTGELYTAVAPATKLAADLTTKVLLAPRPQPDDQGVVPDFTVATTPADIAAGRDPVMERALAMIAAAK